jgi:formate dehydrogenase beta subunit
MPEQKNNEKAIFYDAEKCIGCNACVMACKAEYQWNEGNFANHIKKIQSGSYPQVKWNFIRNACMHCTEATCLMVCPSPGAITRLENGTIFFDSDKCIGCKYCVSNCPFGAPFYDEFTKKSYKCNLCEQRVSQGKEPACVATCLTGALSFGERVDLIKEAKKKQAKIIYGENELKGLHVLYALADKPTAYELKEEPKVPVSVWWWHKVFRPVAIWGVPFTIVVSLLHYVIHGPHKIGEGGEH